MPGAWPGLASAWPGRAWLGLQDEDRVRDLATFAGRESPMAVCAYDIRLLMKKICYSL